MLEVIQAGRNTGKGKNMERKNLSIYIFLGIIYSLPLLLKAELTSKRKLLFFFENIEIRGSVDVFLIDGKREREVTIFADSSIINEVQTKVSLKTLYIDANNTYSLARRIPFVRLRAERKYPVEIMLSIGSLKGIRLLENSNITARNLKAENLDIFSESSGRLHLENISANMLNIRHSGSGDIVLKGKDLPEAEIKSTGRGNLIASELEIGRTTLIHQGTGMIHLAPTDWLDARMLNTGNLILHSKPSNIVIDQKGTGKVRDILPDAIQYYDANSTNPVLNR